MKDGKKFIMSGMTFGFCMARVVTCILRIAWSTRPHNVRLGIAAQIFVYAGIVLLFAINLIFAQRCMRAQHPRIGWSIPFKAFFAFLLFGIIVTLIMLITVLVQSFFTLSTNTHRIDRAIELYGGTFYAVIAFMPLCLIAIGLLIPRHSYIEKFGMGRFRTKEEILALASALLTLGAAFRAGTNYLPPTPLRGPTPWYFSKAAFYCFNFTIEILVVVLYAVGRIDRRFIIPNGAHGRGSYNPEQAQRMSRMSQGAQEWQAAYLEDLRREWPRAYLAQQDDKTMDVLEGRAREHGDEEAARDGFVGGIPFDANELSLDNTSGQWKLRPMSVLSGDTGHTSRTVAVSEARDTRKSLAKSTRSGKSGRKSWRQSELTSARESMNGAQGSGKDGEASSSRAVTEKNSEAGLSHAMAERESEARLSAMVTDKDWEARLLRFAAEKEPGAKLSQAETEKGSEESPGDRPVRDHT
ncbi:MAG: hypothetical protein M1822_003394 [Bathelium mastoideum]|nr:MAG: hypothetical protein M1822_003394 [Bathelium mastoideum]